jgi:hypothetical protein
MDISSWAGIATIASTIIALITLLIFLRDRRQAASQTTQQGRANIYIPPNQSQIRTQQQARRKRRVLLGIISVSLIILIISGAYFGYTRLLIPSKSASLTPTPTTTNPTATNATLLPTHMHPILTQVAPGCDNPKGVVWYIHKDTTNPSCKSSGLVMQQIGTFYAEMDLQKVKNGYYNQTNFFVKVQVTFQNPSDTTTLAAIIVQTPTPVNQVGGLIFTLSSEGNWQLQDVEGPTTIPTVRHGMASNIDPHQSITMEVMVQNDVLEGLINGQLVTSYHDILDPSPGEVGLMLQSSSAPTLTTIQFSTFELDTAS